MIEYLMMLIIATSPMLFMGGIVTGKNHVIRLARNGGEERYPEKVQEAVREYRENNQYVVESWDEE